MLRVVVETLLHAFTRDVVLLKDIIACTKYLRRCSIETVLTLDSVIAFDEIQVGKEVGHRVGIEHISRTLLLPTGRCGQKQQTKER